MNPRGVRDEPERGARWTREGCAVDLGTVLHAARRRSCSPREGRKQLPTQQLTLHRLSPAIRQPFLQQAFVLAP